MKVIIAGSRNINPTLDEMDEIVKASGFEITEILNGMHWEGVDAAAYTWANQRGYVVNKYPANWKELGRRAGPLRNAQMAENADALIAIWDGMSAGTKNMIKEAQKRKLPVYIRTIG